MKIKELLSENLEYTLDDISLVLKMFDDAGLEDIIKHDEKGNKIIDRFKTKYAEDFLNAAYGIKRECRPYLESVNYNFIDYALIRGIGYQNVPKIAAKFKTRLNDRKSKHTPQELHDLFNEAFIKKFGKPYRNALFVTNRLSSAAIYGMRGFTFPVGNFEYIWSNLVSDLLVDSTRVFRLFNDGEKTQALKEIDEIVNTYKQTDFLKGIKSEYELMIWCKEYYWVDYYLLSENEELYNLFTQIITGKR